MTTAAELRTAVLQTLAGEGYGLPISLSLPTGPPTYDPPTGNQTPAGGDPHTYTGTGGITRFSDSLAAGGLIDNADRRIVWVPDDLTVKPVNDGIMLASKADGSTETYRVIAWNVVELGGAPVYYIVQGRR